MSFVQVDIPEEGLVPPRDPQDFLALMTHAGNGILRARNAWLSLVPEFVRRGLHYRAGFRSASEMVAKMAGVSSRQLDDVYRLERQLRPWPPLQRLFRSGVSLSKLLEVAPRVRDYEDARRFTRWIRRGLSLAGIRARLEELGLRTPRPPRGVCRGSGGVGPEKRKETGGARRSPVGGGRHDSPGPEPERGASATPNRGAPAGPDPEDSADPSVEADSGQGGLRIRIPSFEMSAGHGQMFAGLRKLEAELAGRGFPLGELVGRLAERRLGELVRLQAQGRLGPQHALDRDPEEAAVRPGGPAGTAEPAATLPRLGRRLPYVMVVHRNESEGRMCWRTAYGLLPVREEDLAGRDRIGPVLDHDDLHRAAREAAAGATGEAIPAACEREVLLDSSGICEIQGCHRPATEIHHPTRRGFQVDHSHLLHVCQVHHDLAHDPEFGDADPEGPAGDPDRARARIRAQRRPGAPGVRGRGKRGPGRGGEVSEVSEVNERRGKGRGG